MHSIDTRNPFAKFFPVYKFGQMAALLFSIPLPPSRKGDAGEQSACLGANWCISGDKTSLEKP
jgi:hypothetical protein